MGLFFMRYLQQWTNSLWPTVSSQFLFSDWRLFHCFLLLSTKICTSQHFFDNQSFQSNSIIIRAFYISGCLASIKVSVDYDVVYVGIGEAPNFGSDVLLAMGDQERI